MKTNFFGLLPLCFLLLFSCSDDNVSQTELNDESEAEQSLIIGDWTAFRLGVINENDSEESADDPCGAFQNVTFFEDGTFEATNYQRVNEDCQFRETRQGTYKDTINNRFPEANYELVVSRTTDSDEEIRYPEITFDGNDLMRIQYVWGTNGIAYSFVEYERQ